MVKGLLIRDIIKSAYECAYIHWLLTYSIHGPYKEHSVVINHSVIHIESLSELLLTSASY